MLTWDDPNERYYAHGLDRGVLYIPGLNPIPWNGLTGFDEGSSGVSSMLYRDGVVYLADVDAGDFSGQLTTIFYPDEFGKCVGIPEVVDGFFVDNQKPKRFGFAYRTLVGSGTEGDMFGYQIHLVYNALASIGTRSRKTLGNDATPVEFNFDIVCTPMKVPGYRPTAHYIIDTRSVSPALVTEIENMLYGDGVTPGSLPAPVVLFDKLYVAIVVTKYADGTFMVEGSTTNVVMLDAIHFQINNVNSTEPDVNGQYIISDGGTTTVVLG